MKLVDAAFIARELGVTTSQIRARTSRLPGFPPALRVGGRLRWDWVEVEEWLRKQRVTRPA